MKKLLVGGLTAIDANSPGPQSPRGLGTRLVAIPNITKPNPTARPSQFEMPHAFSLVS
jgi:hypothetical protein